MSIRFLAWTFPATIALHAICVQGPQSMSGPDDGPMNQDGHNVLFAPLGGQAPDPETFRASVLDGWVPQQRSKDFSPATILARRDVVTSVVNFP